MTTFKYPYPDEVVRNPGDDFMPQGKSLTLQSEAEACDINEIVARFTKTGVIDHIRDNAGLFVDLPPQMEYQDALGLVRNAEQAFAVMPAEIRAQFDNSPAKFLRFADENEDYLEKLGLSPGKETTAAASAAAVAADPKVLPGQLGLPGTNTPDVPSKK